MILRYLEAMAETKKTSVNKAARKVASKKVDIEALLQRRSMPKEGKDPRGGLTEIGRAWYARHGGGNLQPGIKGPADTPEKMRRKGSFLTRFYTNPRGSLVDAKGRPTRLALAAQAWGEPVPKTPAHAEALALEGRRLLEKYKRVSGSSTQRVNSRP